ncbi:dihydrodipicolinate synthase family protein [Streptomyces melanogenes]|uniref:dihydrodipicolinate synthase family protein n=1 Tax=Streptomyces melanogenes TaxID=67326 RepID=UPI00167D880C|nr:dihydrodipicolinate synthase family protein [Streptomyces melanogenes]
MGLFGSAGRWEGLIACPLTPYDDAGELDAATYAKQLEFLLGAGFTALCPLMHAGESLNLSFAERREVSSLTVSAAGRAPVVAHVSCPGTDHTVALARQAQSVGAAAVIATTPYHWHPGDAGLLAHFSAVAEAVDISVLAYSPPPSAGTPLTPRLVGELISRHPNFLGLKEASNDVTAFGGFARSAAALRADFSVLGGIEYTLAQRALGGAGSFSILALVAPRLVRELWTATVQGEFERAAGLQDRVSRLLSLFIPRYPAGLKAAAALMGRPLGPTRLPIPPLDPAETQALARALEETGITAQEPYGWDPQGDPDPERFRRGSSPVAA